MGYPDDRLTFAGFSQINRQRAARWHGEDSEPWTGADWSNAMMGEGGEAANVVKKLRRVETGVTGQADPNWDVLVEKLGDEIADTITYLDLLANHYGIDVAEALARKFNFISEREGMPERVYARG